VSSRRYVFDNAAEQTRERFAALPRLFDPGTFRHLEALGVREGWHCLEVGAGGGSVARWLAERVGFDGSVLATDIDTRFLAPLAGPPLEVQRHDITADPLPEAAFDLVHTRLVLAHLPEREAVLGRLVAALKPGGWLLLEEFDSLSLQADAAHNPVEGWPRAYTAMLRLMTERGVDLRLGRLLPGRLRAHGLVDIDGEARAFLVQPGGPWVDLLRANVEQLREAMCATEGWSAEEFDRQLDALDAPDHINPSPLLWAVWGRLPVEKRNGGR
jgi:SAM-dependent methyltransferase